MAAVDEDPFAAVVYTAGIEIDLTATPDELGRKLTELSVMETDLLGRGIRCALKQGGQDCRDCPEATLDPTRRLSKLCRVGKDQQSVWAAGEARQEEALAPFAELAKVADEMSEIGFLTPEYAELLMAVGL